MAANRRFPNSLPGDAAPAPPQAGLEFGGVAEKASDDKAVEIAAVRLLARREHSTQELRRKLLAKGHAEPAVERVLEKLLGKKLVSDDRYLASFVHHHAKRGQGPLRIQAELRQRGIGAELIDRYLETAEVDWGRLAAEVRQRKFGRTLPRGMPERAKQARFLQYRGFSAEQIRAALKSDVESETSGWES